MSSTRKSNKCSCPFQNAFTRFFRLPGHIICLHMCAKLVFGIGLGMLLAGWFPLHNWRAWGWVFIGAALLLSIPGAYRLLKK